jgi:uncharacterized protein YndB with AHSA1/START domain
MDQGPVVRVTRRFAAAPEHFFDAFVDPRTAGRFLFRTEGGELVRCELDVRVGGKWEIAERRGEEVAVHHGEYLRIDRPRLLVFTFGLEGFEGFNPVTVEITPTAEGSELVLTQEMLPQMAEWADRTQEGWTSILARLGDLLG